MKVYELLASKQTVMGVAKAVFSPHDWPTNKRCSFWSGNFERLVIGRE
jgi:hypothetical protein